MSVKIRLARHGAKKSPFYRVVIADERSRRNGRYIELVGRYDPRTSPSLVDIDLDRVDEWISQGAQPTEAAEKLIAIARGEKTAPEKVAKPSKRAKAKAEADEKEAAAAVEAPVEADQDSADVQTADDEAVAETVDEEPSSEDDAQPADVEEPVFEEFVEETPEEQTETSENIDDQPVEEVAE